MVPRIERTFQNDRSPVSPIWNSLCRVLLLLSAIFSTCDAFSSSFQISNIARYKPLSILFSHARARISISSLDTNIDNQQQKHHINSNDDCIKEHTQPDSLLGTPSPSVLNPQLNTLDSSNHTLFSLSDVSTNAASTRRLFMTSTLLATGALCTLPCYASELQWEASPINKRSGVTVFDAEQSGYNVRFVTYLSRFLLNFDADCQRWWYARAADIPRNANADKVANMR